MTKVLFSKNARAFDAIERYIVPLGEDPKEINLSKSFNLYSLGNRVACIIETIYFYIFSEICIS